MRAQSQPQTGGTSSENTGRELAFSEITMLGGAVSNNKITVSTILGITSPMYLGVYMLMDHIPLPLKLLLYDTRTEQQFWENRSAKCSHDAVLPERFQWLVGSAPLCASDAVPVSRDHKRNDTAC